MSNITRALMIHPPQGGSTEELESQSLSSIEFNRSTTGKLGWAIKIYSMNDDMEGLPERLQQLDAKLKTLFKEGE